jgi:hypothetical protein
MNLRGSAVGKKARWQSQGELPLRLPAAPVAAHDDLAVELDVAAHQPVVHLRDRRHRDL